MPRIDRAEMEPYAHHVLVCVGEFCSPGRGGRGLYSLLAELLQREGLLFGPQRVKRGETPCLGVCAGGPIVVVYPEGVWYAGVTPPGKLDVTPKTARHISSDEPSPHTTNRGGRFFKNGNVERRVGL